MKATAKPIIRNDDIRANRRDDRKHIKAMLSECQSR